MRGEQATRWDAWLALGSRWFTIERFTPDREDELVQFFRASYRDQPTAELFRDDALIRRRLRWLNDGNPARFDGQPAWVCLHRNRIVGHFAVLAAEAVTAAGVVPVCWGRDLIVAPDARRLGAGPLLVMTAVRGAARPFFIAGLNQDSYSLCLGLGFHDGGRLPFYVKVHDAGTLVDTTRVPRFVRPAATAALAMVQRVAGGSAPRTPSLVLAPLDVFDEEFDRWWRGVEPAFGCVVRRTSATLTWRYLEHPWHRYSCFAARDERGLRGVVILRVGRSRGVSAGFISEVLARRDDREALHALLTHAADFFASLPERPVFVRCSALGAGVGRAMRRAGFLPAPGPFRWVMIEPDATPRLGPLRQDGWLLTGGDGDLDML